jgi:hypothetical protein
MKQDYSVKDILNAVDDILKVKSSQVLNKKIANEIPVKDILSAVDNILKVKSLQSLEKEIINEIYLENESTKKVVSNLESKKEKENEIKKKYDLLVMNNAKDILILNRIINK